MKEEQNINGLPKDWKWVKLGEACNVIMGQSPPSTSYNTDGVGLPFFQGKAEFTELHPIVEKWCDAPNKIALPNDILLSVRAPVGTTNIANQKCCIGRGLAAIRFDNYKYAFYFLRSIQQELDSKGTGTTFRAISGETIRETIFPLPPKETQQQIVSKIEELFSELDKGIEELKTAQQQLKVYRQAVLKWAFEGKLTNENVKDGELPEGWQRVCLDQVCSLITDGKHGDCINEKDSGYYFLSAKDVRNNTLLYENARQITQSGFEETHRRTNLKPGDICLVNTGATIGRISLAPNDPKTYRTTFQKSVAVIKCITYLIENKYLSYVLKSDLKKLVKISSGTAVPNLLLGTLKKHDVALPPLEEQQQIVQEIESRLSVCDKIEETITDSLKQAEALRQSILKKAFEGKLVDT
jgi:type I restriction enzyme, S subunit